MRFAKGHGTENDFVVLPDFEDDLVLTPALVTRLCDRRAGLGGDGVLRGVLAAAAARAAVGNGNGPPEHHLAGRRAPPPRGFSRHPNAARTAADTCRNGHPASAPL